MCTNVEFQAQNSRGRGGGRLKFTCHHRQHGSGCWQQLKKRFTHPKMSATYLVVYPVLWLFLVLFFLIIRLPPEFLPASGPTERWCASTLGAALLCSSRAGSDLGLVSRLVWGLCQVGTLCGPWRGNSLVKVHAHCYAQGLGVAYQPKARAPTA